jgi:hypothetical protein
MKGKTNAYAVRLIFHDDRFNDEGEQEQEEEESQGESETKQ